MTRLLWLGVGWLALVSANQCRAGQVYSSLDLVAASEPVPVSDMISGWDGSFQPGEFAYADMQLAYGVEHQGWRLGRVQRWYYYLTFSKSTSRFFNSLERGAEVEPGRVDLQAKSFQSYGLTLAKTLTLSERIALMPEIEVFNIGHYQFGRLKGVAEGGKGERELTASAVLDYYFDDDKILEYQDDHKKGSGASVSLTAFVSISDSLSLEASVFDAWNQLTFEQASFTRGCIEFNSPTQAVCSALGSVSGRSGLDQYTTSIPVTIQLDLDYQPSGVALNAYQHGRYQRLGVSKRWNYGAGDVGLQAFSSHQLGFFWHSKWHRIGLAIDDLRRQNVRDADVSLALFWRW